MLAWLAQRFDGLDEDVATRKLIAAAVAAEQVLDLVDRGVTDFHFYTMNRADLVYAICHLLGLRPSPASEQALGAPPVREKARGPVMQAGIATSPTEQTLRRVAAERILVLDGAMRHRDPVARARRAGLSRRALRCLEPGGARQQRPAHPQPAGEVREIHLAYFRAGADIVSTNTFSSTRIAQADYGMAGIVHELNVEGAELARAAADLAQAEDGRRRFVAGALGPTNRTASISPDVAIRASAPSPSTTCAKPMPSRSRACSTAAPTFC